VTRAVAAIIVADRVQRSDRRLCDGARASDVRAFCAGRTNTGLLRVDQAGIEREAHRDGKWLIRTSDENTVHHGCACRCRSS
jgi:hypothetical protein